MSAPLAAASASSTLGRGSAVVAAVRSARRPRRAACRPAVADRDRRRGCAAAPRRRDIDRALRRRGSRGASPDGSVRRPSRAAAALATSGSATTTAVMRPCCMCSPDSSSTRSPSVGVHRAVRDAQVHVETQHGRHATCRNRRRGPDACGLDRASGSAARGTPRTHSRRRARPVGSSRCERAAHPET